MDLPNFDSETNTPVLIICENDKKNPENKSSKTVDEVSDLPEISQSNILIQVAGEQIDSTLISNLLKICKPGAVVTFKNISSKDVESVEFNLKINGFVNVKVNKTAVDNMIIAYKPKYDIGSSAKLNLKNSVWKLEDDEDEIIDPDNLLDEEDLKKPDPSSLKVCGTTGKRKACKDCSCGLADELAAEVQNGKIIDTSNNPKSSCGSCYLGDAFRCASCPYLGMPAFKPGEKVQLSDNLLKADL